MRWSPSRLGRPDTGIEYGTYHAVADTLNSQVALHLAELILAVLVFVDATDVHGGLLGRDPRSALRLLGIALPLSIGLAFVLVVLSSVVVHGLSAAPVAEVFARSRVRRRGRVELRH